MSLSRRELILGAFPVITGTATVASGRRSTPGGRPDNGLPDKDSFRFEGTHLNAAFAHPLGVHAKEAARRFLELRAHDVEKLWPVDNPRDEAVAAFASLINAQPADIAVVPSTLEGENLIAAALRLGPGRGVITDPFHYDASLAMYGERQKQGMPLVVLPPRDNRIDYDGLRRAIAPETRLVAVSWVSSWTGFAHDLKTVCEIAHDRGALVYADVIQGVGALPLDVKDCGVDFCCSGTYKWLMGDFGTAFLYVNPDRLTELQRVQLGWRGLSSYASHFLPYDSPGPARGDWTLGTDAASIFEVGTPNWCGLAVASSAIDYIRSIGVQEISSHRAPLLALLQEELPTLGFQALTPKEFQGPCVAFAFEAFASRFGQRLQDSGVFVTAGRNRLRVSASVYNDLRDIENLIQVLRS